MKTRHRIALAIAGTALAGAAFAVPTAIAAPTPAAPGTPHGTVTPAPTTSRPPTKPAERKLTVSVQAPGRLTAPAVLVVTGARPGSQVSAAAGRDDQAQAETIDTARADANGRAVLRLAPPNGRWPANSTYLWGVGGDSQGAGHRTGTFRTPSGAAKATPTKPAATRNPAGAAREASGGLAKTGV